MSKNYEKVKNFYLQGLWDDNRLSNAIEKNWITEEEYNEIISLKNN